MIYIFLCYIIFSINYNIFIVFIFLINFNKNVEYNMTTIINLDGNIRTIIGNNAAAKLLRNEKVPAVIYGENGQENIYIDLNIKAFETEYFKGNVQLKIFNLNINGKTYKVIPYQIDVHPVSDRPRHIDFIQVDGKKEIKVLVPLNAINKEKSPGLKKGGYLNLIKRKLQLFVDPNAIPNEITIDCDGLHLKQAVKISQITLPEGTRPVTKKDLILLTIVGRGKSDLEPNEMQTTAPTAPVADKAAAKPAAKPAADKKK